jgi:hypothetical protein
MTVIVLLKFGELMEGSVYYVPFCTNIKEQLHMMWNLVWILLHLKQYSFIFTFGGILG